VPVVGAEPTSFSEWDSPRALMFKFAQCQHGHPGTTIDEQRWQIMRRIRRPADASSGPAVRVKAHKKG
jgi:hypothetical protein